MGPLPAHHLTPTPSVVDTNVSGLPERRHTELFGYRDSPFFRRSPPPLPPSSPKDFRPGVPLKLPVCVATDTTATAFHTKQHVGLERGDQKRSVFPALTTEAHETAEVLLRQWSRHTAPRREGEEGRLRHQSERKEPRRARWNRRRREAGKWSW